MGKRLTPTEKALRDRTRRNDRIRKLYATGKYSVRGLATKFGLGKSTVGVIVLD